MRIDSIQIFRVAMPLVYPFRTSFGDEEIIESVLVRLTAGELTGWGEAASWTYPTFSAECARTQFIVSREFLAPVLLGQNIESGDELQVRFAHIKDNRFAKAAFDLAWWDLYSRSQNQPLWQTLGGKAPEVSAGADFGVMESIDLLLETMNVAIENGYPRIKLKYRPGWDYEMVKAARDAFPDATIHIDCNSAYSLEDLPMFRKVDELGLVMIEQPLAHDDLVDHAKLQSQLQTPICLDESITSPARARKAAQLGAARWFNIKPGRVGGLTPALKIHDVAQEAGIPVWIGGMLESAVGGAHCIALATLPNVAYPSDIFPTERFYRRDLATPPMCHSAQGKFKAQPAPGIGTEPDPEMLAALTVEEAIFS